MAKPKIIFQIVSITLFISACVTITEFDSAWHDQQHKDGPVYNTLILVLSDHHINKQLSENIIKNVFRKKGGTATASYTIFPVNEKITREAVKNTIAQYNFDSVFVTKLLGIKDTRQFTDGSIDTYYNDYEEYSKSNQVYYLKNARQGGLHIGYDMVYVESKLYYAETEKLIWRVQTRTQTIKAEKFNKFVEEIAKKLIEDLSKKNFLLN